MRCVGFSGMLWFFVSNNNEISSNDDNTVHAISNIRTKISTWIRGWQFWRIVWNVRMAWTMLSSFDEISLLFETTQQSLGPRNVVWNIGELSRTITRFHQMMITLSKSVGDSFQKGGELPTADARARNPRFYFVHAGTKPSFMTKMGHQKSGIPCSGWFNANVQMNQIIVSCQ